MIANKYRPATILEVAKRAGVSASTVSRVLNGTAAVAPETGQRVRAAISELRFSPHPAARQLVNRRTNTIGLLLPEFGSRLIPPMLRGMEARARQAGYHLLISLTRDACARTPRPLDEHTADGLVIFPGSLDQQEIQRLSGIGFPLVLLHQSPPGDTCLPAVTIDNKSGAREIINHLIECHGKRRISFLQGPYGHEESSWREHGYHEALELHGLPFDPQLVACGGFDGQTAYHAIQQWIYRGVQFDAVFAGNDDAAMGAIAALRRAGRMVPEDVAVVGFDDVPFSRFVSPPLTTVCAPMELVGSEAVCQLLKCIRQEPCDLETILPVELVIRQSCGCSVDQP